MGTRIELLLVEDTPSDIRLTEEALKDSELDYNLAVVNDGEAAIDYLNKKKMANSRLPDLILLDLNMPKKNGHEVLADIKRDATLRKIPVVLLTVSQRDEDIMEALKLKMNYYLCKPVSSERLTALVDSIFKLNSEEAVKAENRELSEEEIHVRYVLASNPHTSPTVLKKLAKEENYRLRAKVAENPKTPIDVLDLMSEDVHAQVRLGVAENPSVPEHILEKLAQDKSEDVRLAIAENPRMPRRILELLAADENMFVATTATKTLAR